MGAIENYLNRVRRDTIEAITSQGMSASGRTAKQLKVVATQGRDALGRFTSEMEGGQLLGPDHFTFLIHGRGPGKMPPVANLRVWVLARGMDEKAAWAVAKSIAARGTGIYRGEKKGLAFKAIVEQNLPELAKDIGELHAQLVASTLVEAFNANTSSPVGISRA